MKLRSVGTPSNSPLCVFLFSGSSTGCVKSSTDILRINCVDFI